jgi:hypothetical protein
VLVGTPPTKSRSVRLWKKLRARNRPANTVTVGDGKPVRRTTCFAQILAM